MRSRATAFLVFCFGFSWPAALLSFLLLQQHRSAAAQASLTFMMAGPGMAGIACALLFERGRRPVALGMEIRPNWWWLLAYGMGIAYSAIALAVTVFIGRSGVAAPASVPLFALSSLFINPIVQIVLATLWEELGWRGYLYGLWRRFGFWRCSVGTGLVWGIWHAPGIILFNINYPDHPWVGAAILVPYCVLLAPLMTLVRDHGRSVIAAGILHGMLNATDIASMMIAKSRSALWQGDAGLGGFIAVTFFLVLIALFRSGNNEEKSHVTPIHPPSSRGA